MRDRSRRWLAAPDALLPPDKLRPLRRVELDRLVGLGVFEGEKVGLLADELRDADQRRGRPNDTSAMASRLPALYRRAP